MNFKDLEKKLSRLIDSVGDASTMSKVGKELAQTVKRRTRRGFGVEQQGGSSTKLKKLSQPYKKQRKSLKRKGVLSSETTPAKSNLTKTGKLLDSIKGEGKKGEARIYIDGRENVKKAQDQAQVGREFMNLNKAEIKDAIDILEQDLNNDIKKNGL